MTTDAATHAHPAHPPKGWVVRATEALLGSMLAIMCVLVFGNVVLRYGFNSGIDVSDELARLLLVWLTFVGAVLAMAEGTHLGVDTLVRKVPLLGKKWLFGISHVLMLVCCGVLLKGSYAQTVINLTITAPVTGYSMGLLYSAGMFGAIGMGIAVLRNLYRLLTGRLGEGDFVQVSDSEEVLPPGTAAAQPIVPEGRP